MVKNSWLIAILVTLSCVSAEEVSTRVLEEKDKNSNPTKQKLLELDLSNIKFDLSDVCDN